MNDFLKILLNIRSLRAALPNVSIKRAKSELSQPSACKNWLSLPSC